MRRTYALALGLLGSAILIAGCGIQPSGVIETAQAPTGVAPGVTLYFVDRHSQLQPQLRQTNHLGTISEAMSLLLSWPGDATLHTEIRAPEATLVLVNAQPGLVRLTVPLSIREVTPRGIDQIVCTALGVWVQSGGAMTTKIQVSFTLPTPESEKHRTCPVIG